MASDASISLSNVFTEDFYSYLGLVGEQKAPTPASFSSLWGKAVTKVYLSENCQPLFFQSEMH